MERKILLAVNLSPRQLRQGNLPRAVRETLIEIDRSFIMSCLTDKNSETVTRIIIALAHGLGLSVVVEGVGAADQCDMLKGADCDFVQGHYISRRLPACDIDACGPEQQLKPGGTGVIVALAGWGSD